MTETRQPNWRTEDERDWGLGRFTWRDELRTLLSLPGRFKDVLLPGLHRRRIEAALRAHDRRRIALGSGTDVPEGWIGFDRFRSGTDVFPVNLLLRFPVATSSVHEILAEHILEHFYLDDVPRILAECRRALVPRGALRVVCPDAQNIARLILQGASAEDHADVVADARLHRWPEDGMLYARAINRVSHQWGQHKSLLTSAILVQMLEGLGFEQVCALPVSETKLFDSPPDVHPKRFPDDSPAVNFVVEAVAPAYEGGR